MDVIVSPIPQRGWTDATSATPDPRRATLHVPMLWSDCPTCWGQRRIVHEVDGRYVTSPCARCLGLGQTAKEAA